MGVFVTGNTPLPAPKIDATPPQGNPAELDAADINNLWSACGDLRSAYTATIATAGVYATTVAGLAATTNGQYFNVPSTLPGEALILYKNVSGVATEQSRTPTAGSVTQPIWTGVYNGWPDPFFRRFNLTTRTFLGRNRWYWNTLDTVFGAWTLVPNSVFGGSAIRRQASYGITSHSGPSIWLDEMGAAAGDTVTAYILVVGTGGSFQSLYRFDTGDGTTQLASGNLVSAAATTSITPSATPQWLRIVVSVPATATRLSLNPYFASGTTTADVVAVWAFKGDQTAGPSWPSQQDEAYFRLRDADLTAVQAAVNVVPILTLPPHLYGVVGRESNLYFENTIVSRSAADFSWDVTTSGIGGTSAQQEERWTYTPASAFAASPLVLAIADKLTGAQLATASTDFAVVAASAKSGTTPKCIFVGDSLVNAGTITQELLNIAAGDVMGISLLGTRGVAPNSHEGRPGWTIANYTANFSDVSGANPFWITSAINFPQYLTNNAIAIPDWVFIELGINDVFSQTTDATAISTATAAFTNLDTLITSIKAAGAGVKVGLMIPTPPSSPGQDAFGANYQSGQTRWRYKRNIILWAQQLIARYIGQTAARIYLVPSNVSLDTANNMQRAALAPVNSRNSAVQVARQSNGVHPDTSGYNQIADAVWAFLKNN